MPSVDKEGRQVHVRRVGKDGERGKGEGEGKGQGRGLLGKGRGRDLLGCQVELDWIWEEVVREQERRSMARPTTMVSRAVMERSGRQWRG